MSANASFVETTVLNLNTRFAQLEGEVQKIATIVNKISNDQAVADYKHDQNVRVSSRLEEMVDRARDDIRAHGQDFIKELNAREGRLNDAMLAHKTLIDKTSGERNKAVDDKFVVMQGNMDTLEKELEGLRRFVWILTGAGASIVAAFEIISKIIN